jgi:Virulence-associated protein E
LAGFLKRENGIPLGEIRGASKLNRFFALGYRIITTRPHGKEENLNIETIETAKIYEGWQEADSYTREVIDAVMANLDPSDRPDLLKKMRNKITSASDKAHWDRKLAQRHAIFKVVDELGIYPEIGSEFVKATAKAWDVKYWPSGLLTRPGFPSYEMTNFETHLKEHNKRLRLSFNTDEIKTGLSEYRYSSFIDIIENIKQRIEFDGNTRSSEWQTIEDAAFETEHKGFVVAMMKKVIHSVKRKMYQLPVTYHLMFIVTGLQGSGKGTFIKAFSSPIKEVTSHSDFAEFTDERIIDLWKNYLCVFEECEKAANSDINAIKRRITEEARPVRPMGTNQMITVPNNQTCIGDANNSVEQVLNDPTGMRRFAEGVWKLGKQAPEWKILDAVDWLGLWRSVDPTGPDPLLPFREILSEHQQQVVNKDPVEEWLCDPERDVHKSGSAWKQGIPKQAKDLWVDNFYPWLQVFYPTYKYNAQTFYKQMNMLHRTKGTQLKLVRTNPNNKTMWELL